MASTCFIARVRQPTKTLLYLANLWTFKCFYSPLPSTNNFPLQKCRVGIKVSPKSIAIYNQTLALWQIGQPDSLFLGNVAEVTLTAPEHVPSTGVWFIREIIGQIRAGGSDKGEPPENFLWKQGSSERCILWTIPWQFLLECFTFGPIKSIHDSWHTTRIDSTT